MSGRIHNNECGTVARKVITAAPLLNVKGNIFMDEALIFYQYLPHGGVQVAAPMLLPKSD